MTRKDDIEGLVSLKLLRPWSRVSEQPLEDSEDFFTATDDDLSVREDRRIRSHTFIRFNKSTWWMINSTLWMRPSRVVRASDSQCRIAATVLGSIPCSILRHSGI